MDMKSKQYKGEHELIRRLAEEGILTGKTFGGNKSTFYYHKNKGSFNFLPVKLNQDGSKALLWTEKHYPKIVKYFTNRT